jgi:predicted transcriptional regulator
MAMTLRLSDEQTEALRRQAAREHRSMQEVVRLAIEDRIERDERQAHIRRLAAEIKEHHAALLDRLAQ